MNKEIQIVSIEGNIGSGKSTLLENLTLYYGTNSFIIFLKEPVNEWTTITDENNITILEKFYADQEKYSFSFQIMAYISRLRLLKDMVSQIKRSQDKLLKLHADNIYYKLPTYIIITERSLFTDKMVFAKMLYDTGKIEHVNYQIYLNWFNTFVDEFPIHKIIYVKTDHTICYERITTRLRDGEQHISIDYLKSCDQYHDKMLDKTSLEPVCKDQLILDGNNNIYENENILKEWIDTIDKFIHN